MSVVSMRKLLENGVHFGHQTRRWNPKMKPYIYTAKNGVYIIDLAKTQEMLDVAYDKMKQIAENGGKVLFVGTKKQAQMPIIEESKRSGSFYVSQRWLGGTLTNYKTVQKSIKKLLEIEEMESSGSINAYPKKEISLMLKKKDRLENFLGGIKDMKKLPDAIFVVDPTEEYNAVAEANKLNIPVFALCDTNADPDVITYPIPSNDDAIKSVKLMITIMADAIVEAKAGVLSVAHQEDAAADDITMKDVIINVEQQAEENERRRKARMEERNNARNNGPRRFGNSEKRFVAKKEETVAADTTETKPAEAKVAEVKEKVAEDVKEAKEVVEKKAKKVAEKAEEKTEEVKKTVKRASKKVAEDAKEAAEDVEKEVKKEVKKVAKKVKEAKEAE